MTMVPMRCPRCGDMWHVGIGCRNPKCPDLEPLTPLAEQIIAAFRQFTPEESAAHMEFFRKSFTPRKRAELTAEELHREAARLGYVVSKPHG